MLLYIDPGTGSMLFSVLIGVFATLVFFAQKLILNIKFAMSGGRAQKEMAEKVPYLIFSDSKRYWNTFKPICDAFEKRKTEVVYWTASPDDPALEEKYEYIKAEFIGEGNKAFARLNLAKANVLLSTTPGLDVYQWKRSKNVDWYVHVLHAAGDPVMYRMFGLDFYDAVFLSGEFMEDEIRKLEELRGIPAKELPQAGIPYLDGMKERLDSEKAKGEASDNSEKKDTKKPTVLVAPAWGPSGLLTTLGPEMLTALKNTGYNIIVRPHPQSMTAEKALMDKLMAEYPDCDDFHWNFDNDNFNVLKNSDIMISDFSGVIYDYTLVFDKPLIYTDTGAGYNKDVYDCCWLEDEPWMIKKLAELGTALKKEDIGNVKEIIDKALASASDSNARDKARSETWVNIGSAGEHIADYMIKKEAILEEEAKKKAAELEAEMAKKKSGKKKKKEEAETGAENDTAEGER